MSTHEERFRKQARLFLIMEQIEQGNITEENFTDHLTAHDYVHFRTQIKRAFEYQNLKLKSKGK